MLELHLLEIYKLNKFSALILQISCCLFSCSGGWKCTSSLSHVVYKCWFLSYLVTYSNIYIQKVILTRCKLPWSFVLFAYCKGASLSLSAKSCELWSLHYVFCRKSTDRPGWTFQYCVSNCTNISRCCVQNHIRSQNYIFGTCKTICVVQDMYFCICKNIYLCKTYSLHMQNYMFCIAYKKLYILNKKRRAFHEEAPTTKITTDTAFFFFFFVFFFCVWRHVAYYFWRVTCWGGGIRIHQRCVEY